MLYFLFGVAIWLGATVVVCLLPDKSISDESLSWRIGFVVMAAFVGFLMGLVFGLLVFWSNGPWYVICMLPIMFSSSFGAVAWFKPNIL